MPFCFTFLKSFNRCGMTRWGRVNRDLSWTLFLNTTVVSSDSHSPGLVLTSLLAFLTDGLRAWVHPVGRTEVPAPRSSVHMEHEDQHLSGRGGPSERSYVTCCRVQSGCVQLLAVVKLVVRLIWLPQLTYTIVQRFGVRKIFLSYYKKIAAFVHQGCIK